eukprot:15431111-Alexandrium_andersonii.AAC.1
MGCTPNTPRHAPDPAAEIGRSLCEHAPALRGDPVCGHTAALFDTKSQAMEAYAAPAPGPSLASQTQSCSACPRNYT